MMRMKSSEELLQKILKGFAEVKILIIKIIHTDTSQITNENFCERKTRMSLKQRAKFLATVLSLITILLLTGPLCADVRLPHIFSDNMVLQQDKEIPVWGWAEPAEQIVIQFNNSKVKTKADSDGKWLTRLPPQKAGGPYTMTVKGKNTVTINDVLIGEVWLCSGQSNMEWTIAGALNPQKEIAEANYPLIRQFDIPNKTSGRPRPDVDAAWVACSPQTAGSFTAVGYFFARHIQKELNVPIGLINSSWGGSRIEPWTPLEGFMHVESTNNISERIKQANIDYRQAVEKNIDLIQSWIIAAEKALAEGKDLPLDPEFPKHPLDSYSEPTGMYNAMIHPVIPFAIRGALWYQGESNLDDGPLYLDKMKAIINGWRMLWGEGNFPFYYVQLAPFTYGGDKQRLPRIWETQTAALSIPNTGMAVTVDLVDNIKDIHPKNKQDVGKRLALWALVKTYGKSGVVYSGPLYKSVKIDDGKIRVSFDFVGSGLISRDGKPLSDFEIAGSDKNFVPATAQIEDEAVVVSSEIIKEPVAVRFGWNEEAVPNLSNK